MSRDDANQPVLTGGCQCGGVRYEVHGAPVDLYVCHCRECQKQSSSAFGISVIVRSAEFHITRGAPKRWTRPTDRGGTLDCFFCTECGSRVWHGDTGRLAEISVKGCTLDAPVDLTGAKHIWVSRKLAGVVLPENAPQYLQDTD